VTENRKWETPVFAWYCYGD